MARPKIALGMIVKNEAHNLGGLLSSVQGCFDAIYITDTGSTDDTIKILVEKGHELAGCPIYISHFEWVNDFGKARQFAFDQIDQNIYEYAMWMDGDDMMSSKEDFIHFRDNVLHTADCWIANYKYAYDENGVCRCEFLRERIVKLKCGWKWKGFIHEGLQCEKRDIWSNVVRSWWIDHRRSEIDLQADRSRNLELFNKNKDNVDSRLTYYWGKEAFDTGDFRLASEKLMEALKKPDLQLHDRVMAYQYAAASAIQMGAFEQATQLCMNAIQLTPTRAEMWTQLGDIYLKQGAPFEAIVFYEAARKCTPNNLGGATFCVMDTYEHYPTYQIAQIYLNQGMVEQAEKEYKILEKYQSDATKEIAKRLAEVKKLSLIGSDPKECDDIVITTPNINLGFEWDEETLKVKGLGGSETALIEVAKHLKLKTNRPVKVFNLRQNYKKCESGVEYIPTSAMAEYFYNWKPRFHLAWRHATPLTKAPTYVWSHDLLTPGGQATENYTKYICLSGFHREFSKTQLGIPKEKVFVWRNGIDLSLWGDKVPKNYFKVIFSSSPDRGLDRCIEIVKRARKLSGLPLELHLFYGFENMKKDQHVAHKVEIFQKMIDDNKEWVRFHGNTPKKELIRHFMESSVWLYPANFIETHCITALEALKSRTYPMVRSMGALPYTLSEAISKDQCWMTDVNACDDESFDHWAKELVLAIKEERWKTIDIDMEKHSWSAVTDDLIKEIEMGSLGNKVPVEKLSAAPDFPMLEMGM